MMMKKQRKKRRRRKERRKRELTGVRGGRLGSGEGKKRKEGRPSLYAEFLLLLL